MRRRQARLEATKRDVQRGAIPLTHLDDGQLALDGHDGPHGQAFEDRYDLLMPVASNDAHQCMIVLDVVKGLQFAARKEVS